MVSVIRRLLVCVLPAAILACGGVANIYQGMDAPSLYQRASNEYESGDYDAAIRTVDRILSAFGGWEGALDARLLRGHALYGKGDYITARSAYSGFLDRYAGHENAAIAALGICRSLAALSPDMQRDQTYTLEAITVCRNAVIDFAGTPQSVEAADLANQMRLKLAERELRTGDFYFSRKLYDSAIIYYDFVLDFYAETEFASWALAGLYRSNVEIGYDDLAEDARERLLRDYPESEAAAQIRTHGSGS